MEELRFSDYCANCRKSLDDIEKVFFVEKEVGRCFCSEDCIGDYFQPTVDAMREEFDRLHSASDFSAEDGERLAHYQAAALEDPDEIWVQPLETGERHFTFISHFPMQTKKSQKNSDDDESPQRFSYVVVCLAIDGVPSFIFLHFATHDESLLKHYRQGVDALSDNALEAHDDGRGLDDGTMDSVNHGVESEEIPLSVSALEKNGETPLEEALRDGSGDTHSEMPWIERLHYELRQASDIPRSEFEKYEKFVEPTLDDPDEIWTFVDEDGNKWSTFLAQVENFAMVVVCHSVAGERGTCSFEPIFAFPTVDPTLVQHFRKGVNSLNRAYGVGWASSRAA